MEKLLRCTVCTWRGSWTDAEHAPRVEPATLHDSEMRIQAAIEERRSENIRLGAVEEPSCPACGHHTALVKRRSIRPAV